MSIPYIQHRFGVDEDGRTVVGYYANDKTEEQTTMKTETEHLHEDAVLTVSLTSAEIDDIALTMWCAINTDDVNPPLTSAARRSRIARYKTVIAFLDASDRDVALCERYRYQLKSLDAQPDGPWSVTKRCGEFAVTHSADGYSLTRTFYAEDDAQAMADQLNGKDD